MLKVVDLSKYVTGGEVERAAAAEELLTGLVRDGAVRLRNYSPRANMTAEFMEAAHDFFSMPWEDKLAIANEKGPHPQRGFSVVGVEQTSLLWRENLNGRDNWEDLKDIREHFDAGPPDDFEYPNRWPGQVNHDLNINKDKDDAAAISLTYNRYASFRSRMESLYTELQETSVKIMSALEGALALAPGQLTNCLAPSSSEIRLNHYPAISLARLADESSGVRRTWPHTDLGVISLIFQDSVGGLEVEDRATSTPQKRCFAPVLPPKTLDIGQDRKSESESESESQSEVGKNEAEEEVVLVVSDTLQHLTNDVIKAGRHQVSVPPSMKGRTEGECPERYSAVFFLKAARHTSVAPLPQFVTEARPAVYHNLSGMELHQRGIRRVYGTLEVGAQVA